MEDADISRLRIRMESQVTQQQNETCIQCGALVSRESSGTICIRCENSLAERRASVIDPTREYDHRGILMPRRSRIGGIIMPQ